MRALRDSCLGLQERRLVGVEPKDLLGLRSVPSGSAPPMWSFRIVPCMLPEIVAMSLVQGRFGRGVSRVWGAYVVATGGAATNSVCGPGSPLTYCASCVLLLGDLLKMVAARCRERLPGFWRTPCLVVARVCASSYAFSLLLRAQGCNTPGAWRCVRAFEVGSTGGLVVSCRS